MIGITGFVICVTACNSEQSSVSDSTVLDVSFVVTDAMQLVCYDNDGNEIDDPDPGDDYYGQDAQYTGTVPSYTDNGDGTVTDNNTGLMWQQTPPTEKMTYDEAIEYVDDLTTGDYDDWRLPTIKESFSLAMMNGKLDCDSSGDATDDAVPYIDTDYFDLSRDDCFVWSSTTCGDFPEMADYIAFGRGYGINLDDDVDSSTATVDSFVDTHGPGCMRADYKDTDSTTTSLTTNVTVSQAPELSREKWEDIYDEDYPYSYSDDTYTEFDLSNSENAADYVVLYNYAFLVRTI